jgi:hypothetical protein
VSLAVKNYINTCKKDPGILHHGNKEIIRMQEYLKRLFGDEFTEKIKSLIILLNIPLDIVSAPFTLISALFFLYIRKQNFRNLPINKAILLKIGVYPLLDHYYEPLFNAKHLRHPLSEDRKLRGIDFNDEEQLLILGRFDYNDELTAFPLEKKPETLEYCYNYGAFLSGDAEYLYSMIRLFRPRKIIEIGSGNSTLMAMNAIKKNLSVIDGYTCEHICIEPYEQKWLENTGVKVIREKVEDMDLGIFTGLKENDILFIDSSHMVRAQGDVLFEYLEILPLLQKGVIVHIHDIFTPKDYPEEWFGKYFWNEQYLLEAFLSFNKDFRILGATNYLSHKYREEFSSKCPIYKMQAGREPGSFWMVKN